MGGYPKLDSLPRIPAGLFRNGELPWSRRNRAKSLDKLGFCADLNRLLGRSGFIRIPGLARVACNKKQTKRCTTTY